MTASSLLDVVRLAVADLADVGAPAALVGGLAIGVHAMPRTTRDADFAVHVIDDRAAEQVVADLVAKGYALVLALEQTETDHLATVRLVSPLDGRTLVDILFASSGIEAEVVRDALRVDIGGGIVVPVACSGHLVALKILARSERRPQDDQDLGALLQQIDGDELRRARTALALIEERGFARGKRLVEDLDRQLLRWARR